MDDEMDKQIYQHQNMLMQNEIVWNKTQDKQLDQMNNISPLFDFCTSRLSGIYHEDNHEMERQPTSIFASSAFDNLPIPGDYAWHSLIDSYLENVDIMLAPCQQQEGDDERFQAERGQEEKDQFDFLKDN